jgi:hypothetical protein
LPWGGCGRRPLLLGHRCSLARWLATAECRRAGGMDGLRKQGGWARRFALPFLKCLSEDGQLLATLSARGSARESECWGCTGLTDRGGLHGVAVTAATVSVLDDRTCKEGWREDRRGRHPPPPLQRTTPCLPSLLLGCTRGACCTEEEDGSGNVPPAERRGAVRRRRGARRSAHGDR